MLFGESIEPTFWLRGAARYVLGLVVTDGQSGKEHFFDISQLSHVVIAGITFTLSFSTHAHTVASSILTE